MGTRAQTYYTPALLFSKSSDFHYNKYIQFKYKVSENTLIKNSFLADVFFYRCS